MKTKIFAIAFAILLVSILRTNIVNADVFYTTGTNDAMDLDFDGSGTQTHGSLGINSQTFVISGAALPTATEFADITSITIEFVASGGDFSADNNAGATAGGIAIASTGENATNSRLMNVDTSEMITINVTSTSTDPLKAVQLSELMFSSWRNSHPQSQAELTGATVGGNSVHFGTNPAVFDLPVNSVAFRSVSGFAPSSAGDPFRLHHIGLTVTSVPEPTVAFIGGLPIAAILFWRRRR